MTTKLSSPIDIANETELADAVNYLDANGWLIERFDDSDDSIEFWATKGKYMIHVLDDQDGQRLRYLFKTDKGSWYTTINMRIVSHMTSIDQWPFLLHAFDIIPLEEANRQCIRQTGEGLMKKATKLTYAPDPSIWTMVDPYQSMQNICNSFKNTIKP